MAKPFVKKKKKTNTALTNQLVNEKYLGTSPPPISDRGRFLTWCAYMVDLKDARVWGNAYLKEHDGRSLKGVPDKWMNPSACYRARLFMLGAPFTDAQKKLMDQSFLDMIAHAEEEDEGAPQSLVPTIADRVREKFSDVMGELEGMLDDGLPVDFSVAAWFQEKSISPTIASKIANKLRPRMAELFDLTEEDCDPQLTEGYRNWTDDEIIIGLEIYTKLNDDIERYMSNTKKAKAPRKAKPVSVEKKLKFLVEVYQKFSRDFNVNSIDPGKILGAKELWTLNSKYKLLTVYRCDSMGGVLDVARCKVTGFNRNDSFTYRLGRKSQPIVDEVLKGSKTALKKLVSDLKLAPLQERINENTVLLRV